jgi:hypothetical protein
MGHKAWRIFSLFYRSLLAFREQYEDYERKVKEFSTARKTPREALRLNSAELATLLDFKDLEWLRNGFLHELKALCHSMFRGQDQTDLLDRYVSDIFHQISILKEEHYNVKTYAPYFELDAHQEVALRGILDEAHVGFPTLTKHILFLFQQAQSRMEEHIASFRDTPIFIRSLYLHRHEFVAQVVPTGIRHFYRLMYPLGPVEGFYSVGLSFFHGGFMAEARLAFLDAAGAAREQVLDGEIRPMTPRRRELDAILYPLRSKLGRLGDGKGISLPVDVSLTASEQPRTKPGAKPLDVAAG